MRFEHTELPYLKKHPDTGMFYYKRGTVEVSLKTKDLKEAKIRASLKRDEHESAGAAAYRHTVASMVPSYLDDRAIDDNIRESTFEEMSLIFRVHLLPYFGKKRLAQITPASWHSYTKTKKLDFANHRKVMRGFLKWTVDRGYLAGMPDVTRIPKHVRRKRRIASPTELEAIFTAARSHDSVLLLAALALYNSLRRKEIITLRWDGVDLDKRYLTVRSDFNKRGRSRTVPINTLVRDLLIARQDAQAEAKVNTPWVFPHRDHPRSHADVGGLKKAWAKVLATANVRKITWHDLRATNEVWTNKSKEHTDTQREKFSDSSIDVQKRIYVSMGHEDLRGLEDAVRIPGVESAIYNAGLMRGNK